jgi:hypothetical protein
MYCGISFPSFSLAVTVVTNLSFVQILPSPREREREEREATTTTNSNKARSWSYLMIEEGKGYPKFSFARFSSVIFCC